MNLRVSEVFYSLQAEGITHGTPAIFIRLQNCNLICGGMGGKLQKAGKATWTCDTIPVWKKGKEMTFDEIISQIENLITVYPYNMSMQDVCSGLIHIVWTGGEPMLQQQGIYDWLEAFANKYDTYPFSEIETNGTILDEADLYDGMHINQINCSPKLSNSGMPKNLRIVDDCFKEFKVLKGIYYENELPITFKFVVNTEDDIKEIQRDFIAPFKLDGEDIILMPGVDKRADLAETTRFCYEMSKIYGFRSITRGHILAWDQVTGV